MPRYRILQNHEVDEKKPFIVDLTVQGAALYLRIKPPEIRFIVEDPRGELVTPRRVDGLATKSNRTIYLSAGLSFDELVKAAAHECCHIKDFDAGVGDSASEINADQFAEESWPQFRCNQSYYEIVATLAEMNCRAALEAGNTQVAEDSLRLLRASKSTAVPSLERELHALQDKELEIMASQRRYAEEGRKARAAMFIKPEKLKYWPANIEFH